MTAICDNRSTDPKHACSVGCTRGLYFFSAPPPPTAPFLLLLNLPAVAHFYIQHWAAVGGLLLPERRRPITGEVVCLTAAGKQSVVRPRHRGAIRCCCLVCHHDSFGGPFRSDTFSTVRSSSDYGRGCDNGYLASSFYYVTSGPGPFQGQSQAWCRHLPQLQASLTVSSELRHNLSPEYLPSAGCRSMVLAVTAELA